MRVFSRNFLHSSLTHACFEDDLFSALRVLYFCDEPPRQPNSKTLWFRAVPTFSSVEHSFHSFHTVRRNSGLKKKSLEQQSIWFHTIRTILPSEDNSPFWQAHCDFRPKMSRCLFLLPSYRQRAWDAHSRHGRRFAPPIVLSIVQPRTLCLPKPLKCFNQTWSP